MAVDMQSSLECLDVRSPRTVRDVWSEAHARAVADQEPILVPVAPFADDRGWSLMNMLTGALRDTGQVNFSMQYPGVVKAWHRHRKQTDFWICVGGHLKAGVYRESDGAAWSAVIGLMRPAALIIPPGLWHGAATVGPESAALLYYVTNAYDARHPDEERRPWDSVDGFPWHNENR